MAKEVTFGSSEPTPRRRDGDPVPSPRVKLRGAFGVPPSLEGLDRRLDSGTLLTPRRELLVKR